MPTYGPAEAALRRAMLERASRRLHGRANAARDSVAELMSFVMRDERTQQRIRSVPPHLQLAIDFLERFNLCVLLMPPGFGKTSLLMAYLLFRLGKDPTERWLYMHESSKKAEQFVGEVRTYIEDSPELHLVFPGLRPSSRQQDPWTAGAITVERVALSKDPSLRGVGLAVGVQGSRLTGIIVDDILTQQNTSSKEQRDKVWGLHTSVWLHRLDPYRGRMIILNTAWNEDDYPHRLMDPDPKKYGVGWPALVMGVYGDVHVRNVPPAEWNPDELRPSGSNVREGKVVSQEGPYRLVDNDAFAEKLGGAPDEVPLWPEKHPPEWIEQQRANTTPFAFARTFEQKVYSGDTTHCPVEWFEKCLQNGVRMGHHAPTSYYDGSNPIVMGVDLAVHEGEDFDYTCMSTWEFLVEKDMYKLLDVECLQLKGPQIVARIYAKATNYRDCHVVVENVSAQQWMIDFLRADEAKKLAAGEAWKPLTIRAHTTTGRGGMRKTVDATRVNKWHQDFGVESLFVQVMNGRWILPCSPGKDVHPSIQGLINGCIYYRPEKHTSDELMASWFAITWGKQLVAYRKMGGQKSSSPLLDANVR